MTEWFIKKHSSANSSAFYEGPFDEQIILEGLKAARFTLLDFAYNVSDGAWKNLAEIEIFRSAVNAPEIAGLDTEWFVLRDRQIVEGPFSTAALHRSLLAGQMAFSDHVWTHGESAWSLISERVEFARQIRETPKPPVNYFDERALLKQIDEFSGEELLENVLQLKTGANLPLLAQEFLLETLEGGDPGLIFETDGIDLVALDEAVSSGKAGRSRGKIPGSSIIVIFGLLFFGILARADALAAGALEILSKNLSSSQSATLIFETQETSQDPIHVKVSARSGEILEKLSYSNSFDIPGTRSKSTVFSLAPLHLPNGDYRIFASTGDLKKEISIFIGSRDAQFSQDMAQHQKQISFRQQEEKRALYYSSRGYESMAKELSTGFKKLHAQPLRWKSFYAKWRKKVEAARGKTSLFNDADLAYPDEVVAFKAATAQLLENAENLNITAEQRRSVASTNMSPVGIGRKFAQLRKTASHLASAAARPERALSGGADKTGF